MSSPCLITCLTDDLTLSQIRNCIDEWTTGVWQQIDFTAKLYRPVYKQLIADINALNQEVVKEYGKILWDDAVYV